MPRLDLGVALGVGVAGALVDVSSYARLTDGVSYRWGRSDAFYGAEPGTFSFVLDNADGRFTPDNSSSPLETPLTEGMAACISVEGRLTGGTVRSIEPEFPGGDAAWAALRVSCDDLLGELSRTRLTGPTEAAAFALSPGAVWPFSDVAGSAVVDEVTGFGRPLRVSGALDVTFEVVGTAPGGGEQATVAVATGLVGTLEPAAVPGRANDSEFGEASAVGVWVTPRNFTSYLSIFGLLSASATAGVVVTFGVQNDRFFITNPTGPTTTFSTQFEVDRAYHLAVDYVGGDVTFYVDGVEVATYSEVVTVQGREITVTIGDAGYGPNELSLSDLTYTSARIKAEGLIEASASDRLAVLAQMGTPTWASLPADLSEALLDPADVADQSLLDAVNEVIFTEQGELYTTTTGTLTAPTSSIVVRDRSRPADVDYTFDVEDELAGAPDFIRDITNLISRVTVSSDAGSSLVIDDTLTARAGQASATEEVLLSADIDRRAWGQDRLQRGANTKLRIASIVVDAMTTPTDRSADLLALVPGDRVQFTGLPSTVLGFETWDGWFLGADETHTIEQHSFQLHFTPVLPATAVYDTDRFMADGDFDLNTTITAGATTILIDPIAGGVGDTYLSSTEEPYVIQIDDEQIRVDTVGGSFNPQSMNVTRGFNGTTAAAHTAGALVYSVPDSLYAF